MKQRFTPQIDEPMGSPPLATLDDTLVIHGPTALPQQAPTDATAESNACGDGAGAKTSMQQASRWSAGQWRRMIMTALSAWLDDYAPSMGAALSYYTVFSLAPLLLIVISVAGLIFGADAVRGAVFAQIDGLMGAEAAKGIQELLSSVSKPSTGVLGTVIGGVMLLIGATTVFGELQDALDRIWRAPVQSSSSGLMTLVRTRLLSFGMILGIAFLLTVSLVTGAGIAALGKWWSGWFEGWEILAQLINTLVGFWMTTAVFAMIYKLMPRAKVSWGDVWVGAAATALLFTVGRFLISLYIGKTGVASGFGAAGSVVVIFVWVYYSAQIFLVGAEFTWVYAHHFGSRRDSAHPPGAEGSIAAPMPTPTPARIKVAAAPAPANCVTPPFESQPDILSPPYKQHRPTVPLMALVGVGIAATALLTAQVVMRRHGRDA